MCGGLRGQTKDTDINSKVQHFLNSISEVVVVVVVIVIVVAIWELYRRLDGLLPVKQHLRGDLLKQSPVAAITLDPHLRQYG